jgi:hypothetical protein
LTGLDLDALGIAILVGEAIDRIGGTYFVGGSLASSMQGDPRATNDIDFVISIPAGSELALRDSLGGDFELDTDALRDALRRSSSMNGFYLPLLTKIDLFGLGPSPYDQMEFSRRRPIAFPDGRTLVVKAPEDSVLRKLLWYRAGGEISDRQWRDVVSILRAAADLLDRTYLADWAGKLGCSDLLSRAQAAVPSVTYR